MCVRSCALWRRANLYRISTSIEMVAVLLLSLMTEWCYWCSRYRCLSGASKWKTPFAPIQMSISLFWRALHQISFSAEWRWRRWARVKFFRLLGAVSGFSQCQLQRAAIEWLMRIKTECVSVSLFLTKQSIIHSIRCNFSTRRTENSNLRIANSEITHEYFACFSCD